MKEMTLRAIGRVRADDGRGYYALEIDGAYREGLLALSEFGRINALWWADRMDSPEYRGTLSCELPYAPGVRAGVFACRSEYRPNPVALTSCGIVSIDAEKGLVVLDYIDAFDGTPLLDVKPYIPVCDRAREVRVAPWFGEWPECIEDSAAFFANFEF
ncbi:MAG: SAM-dependent methyltransferase [Spirochaetes bacterium]|nr:SAM-dependent methyltransferase [Spirochaetota bacterium]MBU1079044.1 SAM-dependent methyltransferase [Spirochaetota bacterium]